MKTNEFIGYRAMYDKDSGFIFGVDDKEKLQPILEVRGWGAIQNLFKDEKGAVDFEKAKVFQDDMGAFIADAISAKLLAADSEYKEKDIPDFSSLSPEQKDVMIKQAVIYMVVLFRAAGLKTHIKSELIDEDNGEEFLFELKKIN